MIADAEELKAKESDRIRGSGGCAPAGFGRTSRPATMGWIINTGGLKGSKVDSHGDRIAMLGAPASPAGRRDGRRHGCGSGSPDLPAGSRRLQG